MICAQTSEEDPITVKLHNDPAALNSQRKSVPTLHRVVATRDRTVLWETVIPSPGVAMDCNKYVRQTTQESEASNLAVEPRALN